MKNKFILTEDESKRILSLHKKKINEERGDLQEADPTATVGYTFLTLGLNHAFGATAGKSYDKVKRAIFRCDLNQDNNPSLSSDRIKNIAKNINVAVQGTGTEEDRLFWNFSQLKKFDDFCAVKKSYYKQFGESLWNALDGDIDLESEWKRLWNVLKNMKSRVSSSEMQQNAQKCGWGTDVEGYKNSNYQCPKKGGSGSESCPKIVKSFTDQGYVKITQKRYQELANNNTRDRQYKYCPVSKKNLYFAKVISGNEVEQEDNTGGTGGTGGGGGGGRRGQRYGFDYQEALNALKTKCPGGGGGSSNQTPEYADDWRATQDPKEVQVDLTVDKNKVQDWAS